MTDNNEKQNSMPSKIDVSLKAGGIFFAVANIICVGILTWAYLSVKLEPKTLSVTGSARKEIQSDWVCWSGEISAKNEVLSSAYDALKNSADLVKAYIIEKGIPEKDITFSAIITNRRFHIDIIYPPQGDGEPVKIETEKVVMYTLTQTVSISSSDVIKVPLISRNITSLIKDGVEIDSEAPSYLYTKLAELKLSMLADATKDATLRAEAIVNNANGQLGRLVEARMGVIQINPKGISATSSEGINDTTSFEKEICTVVSTRFEVK